MHFLEIGSLQNTLANMTKQEMIDIAISVYPEERRFIEYISSLNNKMVAEIRLFLLTECSSLDTMIKILRFLEEVGYPIGRVFEVKLMNGTCLEVKSLKELTKKEKDKVSDIVTYWQF